MPAKIAEDGPMSRHLTKMLEESGFLKFCKCILRIKEKPTKERNQTGFKLLLPSIPMENIYRVFRQLFDVQLFDVPPRNISCLKSQERYPEICKDFKKHIALYPFKEGTWRSIQDCHQEIKN